MKRFALAISILASASGAAIAADLPVKAVAPPPPIPSWAGFYIGGHGGYGWKDDPFSDVLQTRPVLVTINGFNSRGWVAGGQVGYNWQYGAFVGGLELDLSATDIKGNSATAITTFGDFTQSESRGNNVKLLGTARGRFGWAPSSDWLLYGTGGLAWERMDQTSVTQLIAPGLGSQTQIFSNPGDFFGWVLGAGVEARLWGSNWIARLEYLHYDFGHTRSASTTISGFPGGISTNSPVGDQTIDVVRAGLSYKFGY